MTVSLSELTRTFLRIGLLSFGGPAAQIALMHRTLIDEKKWVEEADYLRALSFCMLLPGPEAMQLATWIGWRMQGPLGGLIAGGLFVLPGAIVVLALSVIFALFGQVPLMAALFTGVQAAVVAIVIEALLRVSKRALKTRQAWWVAGLAFLGLFAFNLPFPLIIIAAALWGFWQSRGTATSAPMPAVPLSRTLMILVAGSVIWLAPLAILWAMEAGILVEIGAFFAKLAILTFGGAYAVLAWMAQEVVQDKGWLTLAQMMDGLGLAETTPGPLILVTEFVGFMAAYRDGGLWQGIAAAVLTLWVTFVPSFLFIFVGAPYVARLTGQPRLSGALSAITAAVVGVIANLSLWFALHVVFANVTILDAGPLHLSLPDLTSLRPLALAIGIGAAWALLRAHWPLVWVLVAAAGASASSVLL